MIEDDPTDLDAERTIPGTLDLETCRRSPLFDKAPMTAVRLALEHGRVTAVPAGAVLLQPEVDSGSVFVLLEGGLAVHPDGPESPSVAVLEPGACVGELSVVDHKPPSAWVLATNNCRVLVLPGAKVWDVVEHSHRVAINLLNLLAARARTNIDKMRDTMQREQEARHEAMHDALTGLPNRRWMEAAFGAALLNSEGMTVTLAMMDVDHFKRFNDTHGHQAGDRALQHVAEKIRLATRQGVLCARYGGEEFAMLLPGPDLDTAKAICDRVRHAIKEFPVQDFSGDQLETVTISIGLAIWDGDEQIETLVERADDALYQSKCTGRDKVSVVSKT
jgi:diguanylate cyclase (GGDEF)-like protein